MAQPIPITIIRDPAYSEGESLQIEVDGELQPDLVAYWQGGRDRAGFGFDDSGRNGFGVATTPAFGDGVFGFAGFNADPPVLNHSTARPFEAGDYSVRIRGRDAVDNVGPWSDPITIYHRPAPPPVSRLRLDGNELHFTY